MRGDEMKIFKTIQRTVNEIEQVVFSLSAFILVGITVLSVFMRYVLSAPLAWAEEVQMILIVWMTFFGGSIAFSMKGHIAIDIITNNFNEKVQAAIDTLIWILVMLAICWILKLEYVSTPDGKKSKTPARK